MKALAPSPLLSHRVHMMPVCYEETNVGPKVSQISDARPPMPPIHVCSSGHRLPSAPHEPLAVTVWVGIGSSCLQSEMSAPRVRTVATHDSDVDLIRASDL